MTKIFGIAVVLILIASIPTHATSHPAEWTTAPALNSRGPSRQHYQFREDAQEALDNNAWLATHLDPDMDGIACNKLPAKADVLPTPLLDALMLEMGVSNNFPTMSFALDLRASLAGFVHQWDVKDVEGVMCPDLSTGDTFHDLIPSGSVVFLQDAGGHTPQENPDATYMNPTWVENALLWVWDGQSDPVNVNDWLLRNGYGVYSKVDTPKEWRTKFEQAGQTARERGAGIWGECRAPKRPMLRDFAPIHEAPAPTVVASVSGDWSKSANLTVPEDGTYEVAIRCPGPSCYIEVKTLRHLETGQEFPQLYFLMFGPDAHFTELYLPAGTYLLQIEGVGGWFFSIDSLD